MKCNKEDVLTKSVPFLSVIFFALFPILALYAHNAGQLVLSQLLMPVVFSLTLSAIIFFLWFAILKNILQASIVTVLFLVVFWNYGLLYSGIVRTLNLKHWHLIPLLFFIYLHIAYFVTKINRQKTLFDLNAILFFPVTLLIVFNLITIFPAEYKKLRTEGSIYSINGLGSKSTAIKNYPDIYIIICDEYASLKTIREEWGYDNSAFANFLKDKGFFVAENSKARFNQTTWNISCLLNINFKSTTFGGGYA